MSGGPRVSVLTPVYNMEAFIGPAIESVLAQTMGDFELVLVDDCSTDNSMSIMQDYAARDGRIRIYSTPVNSWAHAAGNVGLDHARGEYVAILDADDLLPPDRFEKQLAVLDANPDIDVCGGWMQLFDESDKLLATFQRDDLQIRMGMVFDSTMGHGTAMIRRSVIEDHGIRYDTDIYYAHDYHFFTQLAFDGHATFTSIPEVVYLYRWHAAQTSNARRVEQIGYSDQVRRSVLARFGIVDEDIVETHLRLARKEAQRIENPVEALTAYFEAMAAGNAAHGIFPEPAFRRYLASKICRDMRRFGVRGIGLFLAFPHRGEAGWSVAETLGFVLKSLRPARKR
jgi:glycosyltransferase involved in cell wall biosynthesis